MLTQKVKSAKNINSLTARPLSQRQLGANLRTKAVCKDLTSLASSCSRPHFDLFDCWRMEATGASGANETPADTSPMSRQW